MYGIQGEFRRLCFDKAVFSFGRALESELNKIKGKNEKSIETKRERLLSMWLGQPVKYREPQATSSPTAGTEVSMSTKVIGGM